MPYKFTNQPLQQGLYEPEGIYLHLPYAGDGLVLQQYGTSAPQTKHLTYNGVPLKGHNGVDFGVSPSTALLAVDDGRVVEISYDQGGFGRYVKLAHRWGESLCALVGEVSVDSGRQVGRGEVLGRAGDQTIAEHAWVVLHFGIRVLPYNRYDGWGGYVNPLAYFDTDDLAYLSHAEQDALPLPLHQLDPEEGQMRRP
jgi:murein DD-endopeptidase MepM/ murein hydrolase activator NlpD